jgi:hypothetical protein
MTICRLMSKHRRWQIAVCVTSNLIKVQNNLLFCHLIYRIGELKLLWSARPMGGAPEVARGARAARVGAKSPVF